MIPVALATQLSTDHGRVRHEFGGLLGEYKLGPAFTPGLESKHALICLHHFHSRFSHHSPYAGQRP